MAKILEAQCALGVVTVGGVPVECEILSEGQGASNGILVLDQDRAYYIASSALDLKATLTKVVSALNSITNALTSIGAAMTGPTTAPPPTLGVDLAIVSAASAELEILKELLI